MDAKELKFLQESRAGGKERLNLVSGRRGANPPGRWLTQFRPHTRLPSREEGSPDNDSSVMGGATP